MIIQKVVVKGKSEYKDDGDCENEIGRANNGVKFGELLCSCVIHGIHTPFTLKNHASFHMVHTP
jgi:hypothetical protein